MWEPLLYCEAKCLQNKSRQRYQFGEIGIKSGMTDSPHTGLEMKGKI